MWCIFQYRFALSAGRHQLWTLSPHSVTGDRTETAAAHRIFSTQSLREILNNKYHTNNEWASGCSCLQGIISNFLPMFHIPTSSCSYSLWLKPSLLSTALIYFSNQHVNPAGTRLLHSSVDKLRQKDGHRQIPNAKRHFTTGAKWHSLSLSIYFLTLLTKHTAGLTGESLLRQKLYSVSKNI